MASYADMFGLVREARIRLSVFLTCGVSLSHSCKGDSLSTVARALMKWSLNIHAMVVRFNQHKAQSFSVRFFLNCLVH